VSDHVSYHWVRLSDAQLANILDGPDEEAVFEGPDSPEDALLDWIDSVIEDIEGGLETA
jgi:hypothetical protein